jgi:tetraacyldisaccharide 4'-kinase
MSLLVADIVDACGAEPWFLSRGYGGRLDGQERVDPGKHSAAEVGDEPLLLAARAPTVISRDRRLGAEFIARFAPPNAVIIMDDGLQNPTLAKDLTIAVVDAARGLGNGTVIPAGPLRAPLQLQLAVTDLIVINGAAGDTARCQLSAMAATASIPCLCAKPVAHGETKWLKNASIVAYAGIANPDRFFSLLEMLGAKVIDRVVFADHETVADRDAEDLLARAKAHNAQLVTTAKDFVRLAGLDGARVGLRNQSKTLDIILQMPDADRAVLSHRIAELIARRS